MRRLEAHEAEFKLALVFKINALRMLVAGKAKEYFDLCEADRDTTHLGKSYEELLTKVKDYCVGESWIVQHRKRCSTKEKSCM